MTQSRSARASCFTPRPRCGTYDCISCNFCISMKTTSITNADGAAAGALRLHQGARGRVVQLRQGLCVDMFQHQFRIFHSHTNKPRCRLRASCCTPRPRLVLIHVTYEADLVHDCSPSHELRAASSGCCVPYPSQDLGERQWSFPRQDCWLRFCGQHHSCEPVYVHARCSNPRTWRGWWRS